MNRRLKVLVSAFCCDAYDVSEDLDGFEWVRALAGCTDLVVFTLKRAGRPCGTEALPGVRTEFVRQSRVGLLFPRLEAAMAPSYLRFAWRVGRRAREIIGGECIDLVHQVTPASIRFASPVAGVGVPFVLGPVGGGLDVPPGFAEVAATEPFYHRLRRLDGLRMRLDPALRRTFACASRIMVQGTYVIDALPTGCAGKTDVMLGAGVRQMPEAAAPAARPNHLRVLYVGRLVATKGLRYVVQALTQLRSKVDWRLTVVGDGPERAMVQGFAASVPDPGTVVFAGRVPHEEVNRFYAAADVLCFPSLKEAGGNVVLEAMSHGLPVIVCDRGGPATTVTPECGFKLPVKNPRQLVEDLARALRTLAENPDLRRRMGEAGRARVAAEYLWEVKAKRMLGIYHEVLEEAADRRRARRRVSV